MLRKVPKLWLVILKSSTGRFVYIIYVQMRDFWMQSSQEGGNKHQTPCGLIVCSAYRYHFSERAIWNVWSLARLITLSSNSWLVCLAMTIFLIILLNQQTNCITTIHVSMTNVAWLFLPVDDLSTIGSLEGVHDTMHDVLGGNGHMGVPDYVGLEIYPI